MTPVRLEPAALRSRVEHSTIDPLRSLYTLYATLVLYSFSVTVSPPRGIQRPGPTSNRTKVPTIATSQKVAVGT